MSNKIQVKRGVEANLPVLDVGEPAFTTDTKKPFIGSDSGNVELATKAQINFLDAETSKNIWTSSRGSWIARPMVSFSDDDGSEPVFTNLMPIFTTKEVPLTVALHSTSVAITNETYRNQLLDLQNNHNWEIVAHSMNHTNLTTLTEKELRKDSEDSLKLLKGKGFNVESIFYPFGANNELVRSVASEYFRCGANSANDDNHTNLFEKSDIYNLTRVPFGYSNTKTLNDYKAIVDNAVVNKSWLIFIGHAWDTNFDENQRTILGQLIDYIKSINVDIVNIRDGLNYFEPLLASGVPLGTKPYINILKSGKVLSPHAITYAQGMDKYLATDGRDKFENYLTIFSVLVSNIGFPGAGTVVMIKGHAAGYDRQIWYSYYNDEIQTRKTNTDGSWTAWSLDSFNIQPMNKYRAEQLIADYPNNKITMFFTDGSNVIGMPSKYPSGIITTYRIGPLGSQRQEFRATLDNSIYMRQANFTTGEWDSWKRISGNLALTTTERNALSAVSMSKGDCVFDLTLNKPIWRNASNNGWVDATGTAVV